MQCVSGISKRVILPREELWTLARRNSIGRGGWGGYSKGTRVAHLFTAAAAAAALEGHHAGLAGRDEVIEVDEADRARKHCGMPMCRTGREEVK